MSEALRRVAALVAPALLAACAVSPPPPGTDVGAVLRDWGRPTARYPMAAGAQRLEYASGPYGRTTWMVDVDAAGRVVRARQVLDESNFLALQQAAAGTVDRDEVLRRIGTPGERRHGGRMGGQTWSYRYPTNDCLWFQVSLSDAGLVTGSGYGIDPICDAPSDRS